MGKLMKAIKKPLLFTLALMPFALIGGIFTGMYLIDTYDPKMLAEVIAQAGSTDMLIVISTLQTCMYGAFCAFFGYILADKIGLMKSFKLEKAPVIKTLIFAGVTAGLLVADYWISGGIYPQIKEVTEVGTSLSSIISAVLYGGIIEEIMMRLFLMSLIVFIVWKIFFRKKTKEEIPTAVFVVVNILVALVFAAGHLPATVSMFTVLTPYLLVRCFLLNGVGGILFGNLYRKHGIQYAILCHMGAHIISKLIFILFI